MLKNTNTNQKITRGDIYWADIPYTNGSEQSGKRPVVIVSNNNNNEHSPCINACVLTTKIKNEYLPIHVNVGMAGGLSRPSMVCVEQIRTLDKNKLIGFIGTLPLFLMKKVDSAILVQVLS